MGTRLSIMPAQRAFVRAFSSDGRRLRSFSVERAEYLESLSLATLRRNRKGRILALHFRDRDGGHALRGTVQPGQRYSFEEPIGASLQWTLAPLDGERDDYQRVVLETIKEAA
jgi:hypothetical protein